MCIREVKAECLLKYEKKLEITENVEQEQREQ